MGRLNLVYFVRPIPRLPDVSDRVGAELRYSLRSVAANLVGLGEVHVFGGCAAWFSGDVIHHRVRQAGGKHENTWTQWRAIADACAHGELPERFLLMNDDFFCMERVSAVPAMTSGTIDQWIAARKFAGSSTGAQVMTHTRDVVESFALDSVSPGERRSFELHVPLPVHAAAFAWWVPELDPHVVKGGRIAKRTAYGNLAGLTAGSVELAADVKVREAGEQLPTGPWWSTSDDMFQRSRSEVGRSIRQAFPQPSQFEA